MAPRWAEATQPEPVFHPTASTGQRYRAQARVGRMGTGKASKHTINEFRWITASSFEEVLARREEFIKDYLNPKKKPRRAASSNSTSEEVGNFAPTREKRAAAPICLHEPKLKAGNATPHAGPGRGHRYETSLPLRDQIARSVVLPPQDAEEGNWFRRVQLMQKWKSERMAHLESQVEELLLRNEQQATTIDALRKRVADLERMQYTMAEEIVSYVESTPVLKEATHSKKLEENPEWAIILGLGYTDTQKSNLVYQHLKKLLAELHHVTRGDPMKAKQLSDLLYLRVHAGERRQQHRVQEVVQHRRDVAEGIVESLRSFVHALHDAGGKGRYPDKIRKAQQVVATAVSKAVALSKTKTTIVEIADTLGLQRSTISKCENRFNALMDGEWEELFDERQAERSDGIPKEWSQFALQFWTDPFLTDEFGQVYNFVRRSERASDEIRDPQDRKSKARERIVWLEEKIGVMYDEMVRVGKQTFGQSEFHMGMTFFLDLRPFYVKDATRETCMCVYHLRWREFADGLLNYRKALKEQKVTRCSCQVPTNEKELRKQLICARLEGPETQKLDNLNCMLQQCEECKDMAKLTKGPGSLCSDEMRDPGEGAEALCVKYESYEKLEYTTKDGSVKTKKDFVSKVVPFSEFKTLLEQYWPKFIAHHNDAKWHDDDFAAMKAKLPCGMAALVIDYAENYSHEPRFEHQSKYFSQVQTTIIPVVLMLRIEDLTNISEAERASLLSTVDEHSQPHVISETHYVISSDMQHDNAMVQKVLDDFIISYLKQHVPNVSCLRVRSDGCKAQFKCAANFYWVSRQQAEGSGLRIVWSFFESCHGKCYCDPEGGTIKNAARQYELNVRDPADQLKNSEQLYKWARDRSGLATPKASLDQKKGRGIYRRFFYWVPSKGTGAVDRSRLPKLKANGTSKLHEFVDIGVVGTVSTRRAACNQCSYCWTNDPNDRRQCHNLKYTGTPQELCILLETVPTAAAERIDRAAVHRAAALARVPAAAIGSVICIETHTDEQTYPWVIGEVTQPMHCPQAASQAHNSEKDTIRFDKVRVNEPALTVKVYEPLQPGSPIFKLSNLEVTVPARSVRVIDIQLEATRGSPRLAAGTGVRDDEPSSAQRWKICDSSLLSIRAEMPTSCDNWEVDKVVQYRCVYGVEQWLVKWKKIGDDRNTWEPLHNLLTEEVKIEAATIRERALTPMTFAGLQKFTMVTLAGVLSSRGMSSSGRKADLIARLLEA